MPPGIILRSSENHCRNIADDSGVLRIRIHLFFSLMRVPLIVKKQIKKYEYKNDFHYTPTSRLTPTAILSRMVSRKPPIPYTPMEMTSSGPVGTYSVI